ncbi:MAG: rod shape-determining protein MreC [Burkholderiales bacterium]
MDRSPPSFFNRGPAPVVRLTFFALASILLMATDARFRYMEPLRQALSTIVYPLQRTALAPVESAGRIGDYFESVADLQRDNNELRAEKLRDAQDLLTLQSLRAENAQLRGLLHARERAKPDAIFAEIIYSGRDPFSRTVIVDKGATQGVERGQPVIDTTGLVGQVTRVQPLVSEVTLVTHKDHSIPVQVVRNGLRAVAFGAGDGASLELRFLSANADVQNEDLVVTSGIDGVYPPGLPVGKVVRIDRDATQSFARILIAPAAGTGQHRAVLVLRPRAETPPYPVVEEEPAKKAPKAKRNVRRNQR